jgi:ABC-type polysaccharide/polyol phosphate export permease
MQPDDSSFVVQEIRYHLPEAGEVFLVWGVNDWATVPEGIHPTGTVIKDGLMYTPMLRKGDTFVARLQASAGVTIDYVFQITKTRSGMGIEVWDANGDPKQDYHTVAIPDGVVEVQAADSVVTHIIVRDITVIDLNFELLLLFVGVCFFLSAIIVTLWLSRRGWLIHLRHLTHQLIVLDVLKVALVIITIAMVGFSILDHYGLSWDEPAGFWRSWNTFHLLIEGKTAPGDWKYYGPVFDVTAEIIYQSQAYLRKNVLHQVQEFSSPQYLDYPNRMFVKHTLTFLSSLIAYVSIAGMTGILCGRKYAWIGPVILALFPRFWGGSFFNFKDIPFAALFFFCTYTGAYVVGQYLKLGHNVRVGFNRITAISIFYGALVGVLSGIRIGGIIVVFFIFLAYIVIRLGREEVYKELLVKINLFANLIQFRSGNSIQAWRSCYFNRVAIFEYLNIGANLGLMFAAALATIILVHPTSWSYPIGWLIEALGYHSQHGWPFSVLFDGQIISAHSLPWFYLPTWLVITIPEIFQISFVIGLILLFTKYRNFSDLQRAAIILVLLQIFFLPIFAIVKHSTLYDGMRQFLFVLPGVAVIATTAIVWLYNQLPKKSFQILAAIFLVIAFIQICIDMMRLHPYEYVYFNRFFGGLASAHNRYETDYWGLSLREGMEWINRNGHSEAEVVVGGPLASAKIFARPSLTVTELNHDLTQVVTKPDYDTGKNINVARPFYYLAIPKYGLQNVSPGCEIVYQVIRQAVPLTIVKYCDEHPADIPPDIAEDRVITEPIKAQSPQSLVNDQIITQEIRYHLPEAGEVFLIWGIDGWQVVPEEIRPTGTMIKDGLMYTPMVRKDDIFVVNVQVSTGATIDYVFQITKTSDGTLVDIWDANGNPKQDYHTVADQREVVEIQASPLIVKQITTGNPDSELSWSNLLPFLGVCIVFMAVLALRLYEGYSIHRNKFLLELRQFVASEQGARWTLWGIAIFGLLIRLHAAGQWNSSHPDGPERLWGDEVGYNTLALALLNGSFFDWPGRVPLYPLWLAGVHWLTNQSYSATPYVQSLLGITVIPLTYLLGRRIFGLGAALIGAFLAAVSYPLVGQSLHVLSEVLYTPIVLLVMITLWDAIHKPTIARFGWAGFWVGISCLVRPTLLFFPIFSIGMYVILYDKRRAMSYWTTYVLAASLVVTPWAIRNYSQFNAVFPLATSNGFFWLGSPEYYHLVRDEGVPYTDIWPKVLYASDQPEFNPHSIEGDRYWTARALRSIAREPFIYIKYAVEKIGYYWVGDPNADWGDTYPFNYNLLRSWGHTKQDVMLILFARMVPILALLAAVFLRRNWRILLPIYVVLIYYTLLHAATHAEARLSDPLQPFLMILLGGAVVLLGKRVIVVIRCNLPIFGGYAKNASSHRLIYQNYLIRKLSASNLKPTTLRQWFICHWDTTWRQSLKRLIAYINMPQKTLSNVSAIITSHTLLINGGLLILTVLLAVFITSVYISNEQTFYFWDYTAYHDMSLAENLTSQPFTTSEIRYHAPEAGEVFLVWGINGWNLVSEEIRPTGTVVKEAIMHTQMSRKGDTFIAKIRVPAGTTVDYGFLITKMHDGTVIEPVWEADGAQDYHSIAVQDGIIGVQTKLTLAPAQTVVTMLDNGVVLLIGLSLAVGVGTVLIARNKLLGTNIQVLVSKGRFPYIRDLLRELVARDLKLRYKRSVLGIAWSLLNPLAQLLIFTFLFRKVLPLNIPNYPLFVFTGVLAWSWFQTSVFLAAGAITDNRELIRRPGFPAAILPVVTVTSNLIHFLLALPILLLFIWLSNVQLTNASLLLPLVIAIQFLLTLSLSFLVATFHVTFRDTQHLLSVLLLLLFYLTPVFYDASVVPERFQWFYRLNPLAYLLEAYRAILIYGEMPTAISLVGLSMLALGVLWAGYSVFRRASFRFVEEL